MRYQTSLGRFVSAPSRDEAARLAAEYGRGDIVGAAPAPAKTAALRKIGVWPAITPRWDVLPTLGYGSVAIAWESGGWDASSAPAALGPDGGPRELTAAEMRAFSAATAEVV